MKGKTAGGCRNYKSWLSNPQFFMRLRARSEVVIILCQQQGTENLDNSIGFYIIQTKGTRRSPNLSLLISTIIMIW